MPDEQVCEQARMSRDPRFDGLFYTGVTSTHIYCRTVCPVPTVKRENVRYYVSAAAAEAAGFRPCLVCRPELSPGAWRRGDELVERALRLIDDGLLMDERLTSLATRVGTSERHLRRLFVERLGASPRSVYTTRRLLFAKQLLTETTLPITRVALEAGFGSVRRFNDTFRKAYRMAPSQLRRRARQAANETLTLRLAYRPPYELGPLLDFLRARALPGVEVVDQHCYARAFGPAEAPGWLRLSAWPGDENALMLQLHCMQSAQILKVVTRLRRMFDLDADPRVIGATLARDPRLRPLVERRPGLRLPGGWDGFEVAVRAVLAGQPNAGELELSARLARHYGQALAVPPVAGLTRLFPAAETLAQAEPRDLASLGIGPASAATLAAIACAWRDGRIDCHPEHTLEAFVARWTSLPGVDSWMAHYIAMRAFGHPDALPVDELLRVALNGNGGASFDSLVAGAERWRPWRAYAVMQLWLEAARARSEPNSAPRRSGEAANDNKRRAT